MTTDERGRAESIFLALASEPLERRALRLEELCPQRDAVRSEVESLLAHLREHDALLDAPAHLATTFPIRDSLPPEAPDDDTLPPGSRFGDYIIQSIVGAGGMGVVYAALQEHPRRAVALKVIRRGLATAGFLKRFEREANALARLQHPGIAQIFEAGTASDGDGPRPFIAMELIHGRTLTDYAHTRRLTVPQRLELLALVCDAVQHAHLRGVIHRDLKPANILVEDQGTDAPARNDERGTMTREVHEPSSSLLVPRSSLPLVRAFPKILDFGVARLADPDSSGGAPSGTRTEAGLLIGTVPYMSPEQVAADPAEVDARSDVYALGVICFELLTGQLPLDIATKPIHEAARIILEQEPRRLGSVARHLRGDAETIVSRAMAKDKSRRYQSAGDLARDLRNLLEGRPIDARRDSGWYVLRKTVRRHRVPIGLGALFVLFLALSSVAGWALYGAAQRANRQARELLRESYLHQARATRSGGALGRRFEALHALGEAAAIRPGLDLRDEAIACMTLSDFALERQLPAGEQKWGTPSARGLQRIDRVAVPHPAGLVRVVAIDDVRELAVLQGPEMPVGMIRFTPSGDYLAVSYADLRTTRALWVWSVAGATPVLQLGPDQCSPIFTISSTQGTPWLALVDPSNTVRILDLPSGRLRSEFPAQRRSFGLAADPTGARLAVTGAAPGPIEVFDIASRRRLLSIPVTSDMRSPAWSEDARILGAGGTDHHVHLWDAATGEPLRTIPGHRATVFELWLGQAGEPLASASWDGTMRLWNPVTGEPLMAPILTDDPAGFDGRRLAHTSRRSLQVLQLQTQAPLQRLPVGGRLGEGASLDISADGRTVVSAGDGGVRLHDLPSGHSTVLDERSAACAFFAPAIDSIGALVERSLVVWPLRPAGDEPAAALAPRVVWTSSREPWASPVAGGLFAVVTDDAVLRIDLRSGGILRIADVEPRAERPIMTPDGTWLFVGTWHGESARVVHVPDARTVLTLPGPSVRGAFSPDGTQFAACLPGNYRIYRVGAWDSYRSLGQLGAENRLAGVLAFAPGGDLLAASIGSHTLQLVDASSASVLATLSDPDRLGMMDIRFSPDGRFLGVATIDDEVLLWDLAALRAGLRDVGLDW
jgi:serine/threonine protein kinase/WD40 repeat protein